MFTEVIFIIAIKGRNKINMNEKINKLWNIMQPLYHKFFKVTEKCSYYVK